MMYFPVLRGREEGGGGGGSWLGLGKLCKALENNAGIIGEIKNLSILGELLLHMHVVHVR